MAIYPDKKAGKLTGWFRVEVGVPGGGRLRARCRTLGEAQQQEKDFKGSRVAPKPEAPVAHSETLLEAFRVIAPKLWKGTKTGPRSQHLVETAIRLAGDIQPAQVNEAWVEKLVTTLEARGSKGSTINRYLAPLHKALRKLVKNKVIPTMPDFEDIWEAEDEGRIRWFENDEETILLSLLPPNVNAFVRLAILSGCRRGELFAVGTGEAKVNADGINIPATKAKSGKARAVRIRGKARAAIAELNELGWPTRSQLSYAWQNARETMKLTNDPDFVFHVCRHTCATRMLRARVAITTVRDWLGHADIATTLKYAHVVPGMLDEAADILEQWGDGGVSAVTPQHLLKAA